jgi:hypothetical protein
VGGTCAFPLSGPEAEESIEATTPDSSVETEKRPLENHSPDECMHLIKFAPEPAIPRATFFSTHVLFFFYYFPFD